jgi:hypothetical protein
MPLAKNFAPNNKTVDIEMKCMIKGGALPPFFLKANPDQTFIQFANNPAFAPAGNDVGTRAGAI